jgi:ATP-dependent RNA helicase DHX37/DHR1
MKKRYNAKGRNIPVLEDTAKLSKKERKFQAFMQKELKKQHAREVLKKFETIEKIDASLLQSSKQFGKKIRVEEAVEVERLERVVDESQSDSEILDENLSEVEEDKGIVTRAYADETVEVVDRGTAVQLVVSKGKKRKRGKKRTGLVHLPEDSHIKDESDEEEHVVQPTQTKLDPQHRAIHVTVHRTEEMQLSRASLPVVAEEQQIMEAVNENDVVILCGETGSGKTTQVPQFLYEAGFGSEHHPLYPGMIGVTQPRRVAAVSMAKRVAEEMNLHHGEVTYQIRYDKAQTGQNTRIKFMTDGILLKELGTGVAEDSANELLLAKYSCIIIDEAHERTVGTDILIGWLTRIVNLRNSGKVKGIGPLKLIIMSATLRVEDFTENKTLFPEKIPPVVKVDGRQHKVVIHYNKKTPELDYLTEAFKKVCKIHTKLPPGGVLVFVTGQQEVQTLCRKLEKRFTATRNSDETTQNEVRQQNSIFDADHDDGTTADQAMALDAYDEEEDFETELDDEEEEVQFLNGSIDEDPEVLQLKEIADIKTPIHVLPLYSLLSTQDQMKVFQPPPEGSRLIVVATNVAETSVTIPGIKYVVDCGKVKEVLFTDLATL